MAKAQTVSCTSSTTSASTILYFFSADSILEKSRMLLMSCVSLRLSVSIYSPYSRTFSSEAKRPRRMYSPKTRMEASGVRSSCDTLETKSLFICESRI